MVEFCSLTPLWKGGEELTRTEKSRMEAAQWVPPQQPVHQGSQPPQGTRLVASRHVVSADQGEHPLLP